MFVSKKTLECVSPMEIARRNPNVIFPVPFVPTEEYARLNRVQPAAHDSTTHKAVEIEPIERDGEFFQQWEIVPLTQEELLQNQPSSCTRRQGLLALLSFGIRRSDIEAQIAEIKDEMEREAAQIEYEAATWELNNPALRQMWSALGGPPKQLDELFRIAVTL